MNETQSLAAAACPTSDKLLAFSTGRLSVAELEAVGKHLEGCRSCLGFLDQRHERRGRAVEIPGPSDSSKSSLLDETDRELLKAGGPLSRLKARAKAIVTGDNSRTIDWSPTGRAGQPPSEEEKLPETIGDYFVVKRLGKGGFANVYLALDPKDDGQVAIKVPRTDKFKNEQQAEEFLAEARNASEFKHSNILAAKFVRLPNEGCLLRMKYIEGRSLESAIKAERFSLEQIAEICAQVADGLDYAHRKEMIHRDIKPANILLDQENHPYITDFGLAIREAHQDRHQGERAGTWAYMSPEQIRGESHHLDGRTDVWSLGVILYELLTRQRPFVGKDPVALEEQICRREPKPPRSINREIPAELERICLQCLTKDISLRCPSAADLAESLRAWLRSRQRNRRLAVLALAVVVILGAGGLLIRGLWASGSGGTEEQDAGKGGAPVAAKTVESPQESKFQLLAQKPEFVFGLPLPDPYHDSNQHVFSVGQPGENPNLWIARMDRRLSAPVHLRGTVSLKDWTGLIGFAWQCQDLTKAPGENNRWNSVLFLRTNPMSESWVIAEEITLTPGGEASHHTFFNKEVEIPKASSAELEVVIQERLLKFTFNGVGFSPPAENLPASGWLPTGQLNLALIGQGQSATFKEVTLELPDPSSHAR